MARLSGKVRWAVILGGYFGVKALIRAAEANPGIATPAWTIVVLYGVFVLLTWIADPLFNLLLRLNRLGRLALSREEIVASNWFGACLLLSLAALAADALLGLVALFMTGIALLVLLFPLSATFSCPAGWPRVAMGAYTTVLAALGAGWILLAIANSSAANPLGALFAIGVIASTWAANILMAIVPRR